MTVRVLRRLLVSLMLLACTAGTVPAETQSGTCWRILGPEARPVGTPHLCTFRDGCSHETFACQRFRDAETDYLVAYRGGRVPDAIYWAHNLPGYPPVPLWQRDQSKTAVVCDLPVPNELAAFAQHRGTGICVDELDAPVPCSLYEAVSPRQSSILRHFIFYEPTDDFFGVASSNRHIQTYRTGLNQDAFIAELAWLIGSGLAQTDCCRQRGEAYLNYARELFPDYTPYSHGASDTAGDTYVKKGNNE